MMDQYLKKAFSWMAFFVFCTTNTDAQTPGLGTWNVATGRYTINAKWNVFFETQLRSQQAYHHFNYHEYKGGIGYNFPKKISLVAAMGHYTTYQPDGDFKSPVINSEFRLWQQLILNNYLSRVKLEHRYRFEQRFTSSGYRNRFRYRLNAIIPINKPIVENNTWYLSFSNEIFLSNRGNFFEQNRLSVLVGYDINDLLTVQTGLVNRFDYFGLGKEQWKNFLQTTLLFSFNEGKSGRERHPSQVD
ncbi:MAG: DUF2490 domain-containing protein [Sphingobacteriia bacterium]|nr:MAG: DUF2490 domain-containing protein [Sphingobacteriia bacterium]